MKKSFLATMFFALTACIPAIANNSPVSLTTAPLPFNVKTKLIKEKTFELRLFNLQQKYTYISLSDMKGKKIYFSEGLKKRNGYAKALNISNLLDGKYLLKISNQGESVTQIVRVSGDNVYFSNFK